MSDSKLSALGKYEVRAELGRGAMGTVYEAWDPAIARRVAIKTVRLPDAADEEAQEELARFRREAQAAGRLTHPNIVGVFDYGETETLAYIVMEFVDGRSWKSVLDQQERLPVAEVVRVMGELLAGLHYSHERGVVHRDIKPANLILTQQGQTKIADFGIARIESSSMTQAGTIMGTPAYMSPEQFMGQTVDARTDIYSSGVVLYQLLTGERPFEGSMSAIMHKALNTQPPKPSDLSVTAPRAFDAVVARAMAKRPEDRFASAEAFAEAIRVAAQAPPAPPDDAAIEATVVQTAPRPASAAPVARAGTPPPAAKPETGDGRGGKAGLIAAGVVGLLVVAGGGAWLATGGKPAPVAAGSGAPTLAAPGTLASPPAPGATPARPAESAAATAPPPAPAGGSPAPGIAASGNLSSGAGASGIPSSSATQTFANPASGTASSGTASSGTASSGTASSGTASSGIASSGTASSGGASPGAAPAAAPSPAVPPPAAVPPAPVPPAQMAAGSPSPFATVAAAPAATAVAPLPAPTPPPAPPVQVATAVVSPEALRHSIAAALAGVKCSLVGGTLTSSPADSLITVSGLSGRNVPQEALAAAVSEAAPGVPVAWHLATFDGPYCDALDALRPVAPGFAAPHPGLGLGLSGGRTRLMENEKIIARLTMPPFAGYLQVDYLGSDGSVFHMQNAVPGHAPYPAGSVQTLGEPAKGFDGWEVGEPFGRDMIIAVASSVPLFTAPSGDTGASYLPALRAAMDAARAQGARLSATALLVDTVRKP